ncbi:MAG TPA: hypothetical protein VKE93_04440, partial [Candidatus Angelobacter sp.]|nr:hypothetical protein [Candidatus Angelobacter sp.]
NSGLRQPVSSLPLVPHVGNAYGMRSKELCMLRWRNLDLNKGILTVGESKTEGGSGRTVR